MSIALCLCRDSEPTRAPHIETEAATGSARAASALEGGCAADAGDRVAGGLPHLRTRIAESISQVRQRRTRCGPDGAQGIAGSASRLRFRAMQHGSKLRHRLRRTRPDVADVLRDPGSHAGIGILQSHQKRRQCRTEVEFRTPVGELPPATPYDIQRHGDVPPHFRVRIAKSPRQCGHARRSEGMQLVVDPLTPRFEIRERRRCRRGGDSWLRSLYRQR